MFKRKYDIFISYRRKDTSDKAQHLLTILEYNGYFGRVSFDKENLHGRFDVELLNRIDNCTDFIAMISDETFSDVTDEHTELYVKLATCDPKDFYSIIEASGVKEINFMRIELARAIAKEKNIVPIAPQKSDKFNFDDLSTILPVDIKQISRYHAAFYNDKDTMTFRDVIKTKVIPKEHSLLKSEPRYYLSYKNILITVCILLSMLVGYSALGDYIKLSRCSTINDYNTFLESNHIFFSKSAKKKIVNIRDNFNFDNINNDITKRIDPSILPTLNLNQICAIRSILENMVYVDGGEYMMGSDTLDSDGNRNHDISKKEIPKHKVTVSGFFINKYELSVEEWNSIMGIHDKETDPDILTSPKTHISWNDVQDFFIELNSIVPLNFRLPHETEWEYAAKGGLKSLDFTYAGSNDIYNVAWTLSDSLSAPCYRPRDGISWWKESNELGIFNMSGNVAEYCSNKFYYYDNPERPFNMDLIIVRGGSFKSLDKDCRVTSRDMVSSSTKSESIGFRLVID